MENKAAFFHAILLLEVDKARRHNRHETKPLPDGSDGALEIAMVCPLIKELSLPILGLNVCDRYPDPVDTKSAKGSLLQKRVHHVRDRLSTGALFR